MSKLDTASWPRPAIRSNSSMSLTGSETVYGLFHSTSRTKRRPSTRSTPRAKLSVVSTSSLTMSVTAMSPRRRHLALGLPRTD
jgi:hypothetical protein